VAGSVGLIANPVAGKDVRRLYAAASVSSTEQKIQTLRRVFSGLSAAGVERALYMPEPLRMVPRAHAGRFPEIALVPAAPARFGDARDTERAAAVMRAAGVSAIVCLGGDGTHRALAKGASDVPLLALSTGTNNAFPAQIEGTVAGLAAGALALGFVEPGLVAPRAKAIELELDSERELALIDVARLEPGFVASRALIEPEAIREVVLTRASAERIGLAALGGALATVTADDDFGLHLRLGPGGSAVRAALAPGRLVTLRVESQRRIGLGESVELPGPALLAVDGERERALREGERARLRVARRGPPVVDVSRCLERAREADFFRAS
jgi:predicted polyphosphate/ATP-dependent NAD kinase